MVVIEINGHGVYVINRQSAAKQLWISSPISGPKHFDLVKDSNSQDIWKCNKTSVEFGDFLCDEISKVLGIEFKFT